MGYFLLHLTDAILGLLMLAVFLWVVINYLIVLEVINLRHPLVRQVAHFLDILVTPMLKPFRRFIPPVAGFDLTPLLLLLLLGLVRADLLPWLFTPIIAAFGG
jgi:YggT family protein